MANIAFSNYDLHKQLYNSLEKPNDEEIKDTLSNLGAWFSIHPDSNDYCLMCREKYDFTIFHFKNMNYNQGMKEVQEVLESRGKIIDISYAQDSDGYECWVKNSAGEVSMYLLFNAKGMVIEIE